MFAGPDFAIRWPSDLLADELEATKYLVDLDNGSLRHLLSEAFARGAILDRLSSGEWNDYGLFGFGGNSAQTTDQFRETLIAAARRGEFRQEADLPPRWRQRKHRGPSDSKPSEQGQHQIFRYRYKSLLISMDSLGYFDNAAPRPCVDDRGEVSATLLEDLVASELGPFGTWVDLGFLDRPCRERPGIDDSQTEINGYKLSEPLPEDMFPNAIDDLDEGDFYELVEIFHDLVARPRRSYYHDFAECGYHYSQFAIEPGQRLYRWRVNQLLDSLGVPLRMADSGEFVGRLMETTDEARTVLTQLVLEHASDDRDPIEHAVGLFQRRAATREEKRSAIVALARILEEHRGRLKEALVRKDEGALFDIANNFDLRHNRDGQQGDYDDIFLDWVFWWYLATVELVQRLVRRDEGRKPQ